MEAKWHLTGKFYLQGTSVANCSVDLDPQPNKTINSSALTPSPESPQPLAPTQGLAEGTPLDPAPPASIHGPALGDSTPSSPVRLTPASPLCLDHQAPAYLTLPAPRPDSVTFGPGVAEALPYATISQVPYPPPVASPTNDLVATANATAREILNAPSLLSLLASKRRNTLGGLPNGVKHPAAALLRTYVEEGIPDHTGPPWSPEALETSISKGTHASAYTPEMISFIQGEMRRRIKYGFSILLPAADAMRMFWERLNLSRIAAVP